MKNPDTIGDRSRAPVFVVGSPRSGTTLLYHMLLSAGGFAYYRTETHVFNSLAPRFQPLSDPKNLERMFDFWLRSDMFALTALEAEALRARVLGGTRNAGDFLRIVMDAMVEAQGVRRWAETTPAHLLHAEEITATIPSALIVHVIRDGRDVAVSMAKQQWVAPLPWDRGRPEQAAGMYWEHFVRRGRAFGTGGRSDYLEVRYEALVDAPQATLDAVATFIGQPLDYEVIQRNAVGSVGRPNTSFPGGGDKFTGRWRSELSEQRADELEQLLAPTLHTLGYETTSVEDDVAMRLRRSAYRAWFEGKQWLKTSAPFGSRLTSLDLFAPGAVVPAGRSRSNRGAGG